MGNLGTVLRVAKGVGAIILLFVRRRHPAGYALLLTIAITPCAAVAGCSVRVPSPYGCSAEGAKGCTDPTTRRDTCREPSQAHQTKLSCLHKRLIASERASSG